MRTATTIPATLELVHDTWRLRPWQDRDAPALVEAAAESQATVGRHLAWCRADYGLNDALSWTSHCRTGWERGERHAFAVFERASGTLCGGVGLNQFDPIQRSANLGYWVRQSRQRQGVAAAAAALVADFGFSQLGLLRIEILALPDNLASRRTATRLGAQFERMAAQRIDFEGQRRDAALYALQPTATT